jgi:hypothetical protein
VSPIAPRPRGWDARRVRYVVDSGWAAAEAERAFGKAVRARRRAALARRLLRRCVECAQLAVFEVQRAGRGGRGLREIPVDAIAGSLEPHRAAAFDHEFRPSPAARERWLSVWRAESRGAVLPPIVVSPVGDAYAIRDGHHRVSVARARGACTITALVA